MILKVITNSIAINILAIFGFAITVFTFLYEKKMRICAMYKSVKIENSSALRVNRREYKELNFANIIVWNNSKTVIHKKDIADLSPLRIETCSKNTVIISCELLCATNDYNNVAIEKGEEGYIIDFDFLERNDGCAIQVIYNGEQDGVRVDGKVVGGIRIYKPWSHNNIFQKILEGNLFKKILSCGILFWPILFFVGVMFPIAFLQSGNYWHIPANLTGFGKNTITVIMDITFIIVEILISLYVAVWICIFRYHCLPPKELQNYVR